MLQPAIYKQLEEYYTSFNAISNLYAMWAKEKGISYHTLFTLYALYHSDAGCGQRSICDEWLIPKQTLNSILKALEKDGYLTYRVCPEDRRNKIVMLSKAGMEYAGPILEELYQLEVFVLGKMDESLTRQMIDCNNQYFKNLKEAMMEGK